MTKLKKVFSFSITEDNNAFIERMAASMGMNKSAYLSLLIATEKRKQEQLEELHKNATAK